MSALHGNGFSAADEAFQTILAHRLQHHDARLMLSLFCLVEQAFVDERCYAVQHGQPQVTRCITDGLISLECAAANEDAEPPEEPLLLGAQQVIYVPSCRPRMVWVTDST